MRAGVATDDGRDLWLRMVLHIFGKLYQAEATTVWAAPGPVLLLGGRPAGPSLAMPTRWGARVAVRPRGEDANLFVSSINRPLDALVLDLDYEGPVEVPDWAVDIPVLAQAFRECGRRLGGGLLLTFADVPDESGVAASAALRCAVALAMSGAASGPASALSDLLPVLHRGGEAGAANVAALLGQVGHAILVPPPVTGAQPQPSLPLRAVPFDPGPAGLRLVLVALRRPDGAGPPDRWEPDSSEDARVTRAFDVLGAARGAELGNELGAVLTESHAAARDRRGAGHADLAVDAALAAGALGARATSSASALALVPTRSLRGVRAAIADRFRHHDLPAPRLLSSGHSAPHATEKIPSLLDA